MFSIGTGRPGTFQGMFAFPESSMKRHKKRHINYQKTDERKKKKKRKGTLTATPSLAKMLKDGSRLGGFNSLGHHVQDIMHNGRSELELVIGLNALLRHRLGNALVVTSLEMTREKVSKPPLEQRDDSTKEKEPHSPAGSPETATRTFTDRTGVKTVVDQVLQIL
jgi:hypothetical protein